MALESASYLNGLQSANPPSGDPVTQADDHLRLIKSVLLATFPNLNGPCNATPAQMNSWVPTGTILLWSSSAGTIPSGYALCDGGTYAKVDGSGNLVAPDLRDRFVLGTGPLHAQGTSGGNSSVVPTSDPTTAGGTIAIAPIPGHNHGGATGSHVLTVAEIPAHTHDGLNAGSVGVGGGAVPYSITSPNTGLTGSTGGGGGHTHPMSTDGAVTPTGTFTGTVHTHTMTVATVPPYVSLVYMIKL